MMTYNKTDDEVRDAIEAIRTDRENPRAAPGGRLSSFLPGDGFDKFGAPMLDAYLERLGYTVTDRKRLGPDQFHTVSTECGITVARNGACFVRELECA